MADHTKIEWTEATWNPITGCSVISPGCTNCYAMKLAGTRLQHHESRKGLTVDSRAGPVWTGEVRFNEQWLDQPLRWKRPRMIFVCAHGDLFHESVPDEWIDRVFAVMALAPQHTFQVLTKRSARMREYICDLESEAHQATVRRMVDAWPKGHLIPEGGIIVNGPNVWLGVSVEDQARANERIPDLLHTPAAVRWLSCEPLLGEVDLTFVHFENDRGGRECFDALDLHLREGETFKDDSCTATVDWVVVGGESGSGARPMLAEWARGLRDQCEAARVPFFFKQWGNYRPVDGADGVQMVPCAKAEAGRHLDGVLHDAMPTGLEGVN